MPTTSTTNSPDGAEETEMTAYETLSAKHQALQAEFPAVTFGYLGNVGVDRGGRYDDRSWYLFLPHPGRVGTSDDSVGGYRTANLDKMLAKWDDLVRIVRIKMEGR